MATKNVGEEVEFTSPNIEDIFDGGDVEMTKIEKPAVTPRKKGAVKVAPSEKELVNCLRKERLIVKHIDKQTGLVKDPKHVLYGGMAETATRTFTVPLLKSGALVNVLTKKEKDYLEYVLGLDDNALSVYIKGNENFWSTANPNGVATVTLSKQDNIFDLSNPIDYIKVKILLANKDHIAPSLQALQDQPKATYEFVIVSEADTTKMATNKLSNKKLAYKLLGKIEDDIDVLRFVIETLTGRPVAKTAKLETLQVKADEIIQNNALLVAKVISDELLNTKVLIRKAIEAGVIAKRGDYHYLRDGNIPLCHNDQEPTLNVAAKFLSEPKQQDLKFTIEAKLK